jgi:hypothetical protein
MAFKVAAVGRGLLEVAGCAHRRAYGDVLGEAVLQSVEMRHLLGVFSDLVGYFGNDCAALSGRLFRPRREGFPGRGDGFVDVGLVGQRHSAELFAGRDVMGGE